MNKLKTLEELKNIINQLKKQGKTIVFGNGCFDVIHVGHIRYLYGAKKLGDILIVGLNSDSSMKIIKDKNRPIINEQNRAEILSAVEFVDYIIIFSEPDANRMLSELQPHIHAKGTDYTKDNVPELNTVKAYGGKAAIVGDPKDHSTKNLIKTVCDLNVTS